MSRLLRRSSRRYLMRHPWQLALSVAGVALGVAVVLSIDLANASAARAFELATETVSGRATHRVIGGPAGLPEELFHHLTAELGIEPAAPVVQGHATLPDPAGGTRVLRILGVDPLSEGPFRPYLAGLGTGRAEGADLGTFLARPGAALLSARTATELAVAPGDVLPVRLGAGRGELVVAGLLRPDDRLSRRALADLAVVDVATGQELLGRVGRLSHVDLLVSDDDAGRRDLDRVRAALPAGARLTTTGSGAGTARQITRAFRLNLTALSLLALVCGLFLIYNSITFSVVQRRTYLGTLRALGVTRRRLLALVLGEAALVALVGTAGGLALGVALGHGLVDLVSRTINDLYFALSVRDVTLSPAALGKAAALGLGATVAAALRPAYEATTVPPRAALQRSRQESDLRRSLPRVTVAALVLLAAGGALLAWPTRDLLPGFVGLFALIVGCALLAPLATVLLMALLRPGAERLFGILGSMAARGVVASLSRTAVAIAALAVAVSVTVGVGVMVDSFRGTVERWLGDALSADLYVSPAGTAGGAAAFGAAPLTPALMDRLAAVPGVTGVRAVRRAQIDTGDGEPIRLVAVDTSREDFEALEIVQGSRQHAWDLFGGEEGVLVSEPFAWHRGVGVGDSLELPTATGLRRFPVAAVYASYASDRGVVLISRPTYRRLWHDPSISGVSVTLAPGTAAEDTIPRLRAAAGDAELLFQSRGELRRASLEIFDRTFLITGVLRLLAGLVAFIGVLSALMALQLERGRELGVLRANGLTPGQVWRLVTSQTGLMGLVAGLLSLPVGLLLAAVMIHVINRRSFGWSLDMTVDPAILAEALVLALAAALLAGLYPSWKMSRTPPVRALREE